METLHGTISLCLFLITDFYQTPQRHLQTLKRQQDDTEWFRKKMITVDGQ